VVETGFVRRLGSVRKNVAGRGQLRRHDGIPAAATLSGRATIGFINLKKENQCKNFTEQSS